MKTQSEIVEQFLSNPQISRGGLTQEESDDGIIEVFIDKRAEDWYVTYFVYTDEVRVVESMDDNNEHCFEICESLEYAISVASEWC